MCKKILIKPWAFTLTPVVYVHGLEVCLSKNNEECPTHASVCDDRVTTVFSTSSKRALVESETV